MNKKVLRSRLCSGKPYTVIRHNGSRSKFRALCAGLLSTKNQNDERTSVRRIMWSDGKHNVGHQLCPPLSAHLSAQSLWTPTQIHIANTLSLQLRDYPDSKDHRSSLWRIRSSLRDIRTTWTFLRNWRRLSLEHLCWCRRCRFR